MFIEMLKLPLQDGVRTWEGLSQSDWTLKAVWTPSSEWSREQSLPQILFYY